MKQNVGAWLELAMVIIIISSNKNLWGNMLCVGSGEDGEKKDSGRCHKKKQRQTSDAPLIF